MELKELATLVEEAWGEDQYDAEAFARIIIENTKPEYHERIVREDLIFNRYYSIVTYKQVARAILNDEWDTTAADYLEIIEDSLKNNTCESILRKDGWRIDTKYGGAIGLDYEVLKK